VSGANHPNLESSKGAARPTHAWAADHIKDEGRIWPRQGLLATILRNGWYTENHRIAGAPALAAGALIGRLAMHGFATSPARSITARRWAVAARPLPRPGQDPIAGRCAGTRCPISLAELSVRQRARIPYVEQLTEGTPIRGGVTVVRIAPKPMAARLSPMRTRALMTACRLSDDSGIQPARLYGASATIAGGFPSHKPCSRHGRD